jgi:hypothetical protein
MPGNRLPAATEWRLRRPKERVCKTWNVSKTREKKKAANTLYLKKAMMISP